MRCEAAHAHFPPRLQGCAIKFFACFVLAHFTMLTDKLRRDKHFLSIQLRCAASGSAAKGKMSPLPFYFFPSLSLLSGVTWLFLFVVFLPFFNLTILDSVETCVGVFSNLAPQVRRAVIHLCFIYSLGFFKYFCPSCHCANSISNREREIKQQERKALYPKS